MTWLVSWLFCSGDPLFSHSKYLNYQQAAVPTPNLHRLRGSKSQSSGLHDKCFHDWATFPAFKCQLSLRHLLNFILPQNIFNLSYLKSIHVSIYSSKIGLMEKCLFWISGPHFSRGMYSNERNSAMESSGQRRNMVRFDVHPWDAIGVGMVLAGSSLQETNYEAKL